MHVKRLQQILIVFISLVLFGRFGLPGIALGASWVAPDGAPNPLADSEVRFLSALAVGLGFILLSIVREVERHTTVVRIVALATLGGALVRVLSIVQLGMPPARAVGAMGLEFVFALGLLILQQAVAKSHAGSATRREG
jgi:hypothetical protein